MALSLNTFKNVDGMHSNIMEGKVFNGIVNFTFASGETQKLLLLEIPENVTLQMITSGLTLTPYDNTFSIRKLEGDTGSLTTGTPITTSPDTVRNLNRNISDTPLCTFSKNPPGVFNNDGLIIEDFDMVNAERAQNVPIASKTILNGIERIDKPVTQFIFLFTRDSDTNVLNIEYRFIWIES
jgi:hypothetical protein